MPTFVTSEFEISFLFFYGWVRGLRAGGKHLPAGLVPFQSFEWLSVLLKKICNFSEIVSNCNHLDLSFHFFPSDSIFFLHPPSVFCFLSFLSLPVWVKFLAPGLFARKKTTACEGENPLLRAGLRWDPTLLAGMDSWAV